MPDDLIVTAIFAEIATTMDAVLDSFAAPVEISRLSQAWLGTGRLNRSHG
jgi:hypothetical protein